MSEPPKILIFADAGQAVGGGHVMRCLTLAAALSQAGGRCVFAATPPAAQVLDRFAPKGLERIAIEDAAPLRAAAQLADAAQSWGAHAAVIDHYGFGPGEEALTRTAVGRLLVIDDLKRGHLCDLVLDSNLDRKASDYPNVESLLGPRFALVREAFVGVRAAALARRAQTPRRLLVSLGLTDLGGVTGKVVAAIAPHVGDLAIDIVVGEGAASLAVLSALAATNPRIAVHVDVSNMAGLTAAADLAIGAGGSSVWERCCLGLPSLVLILADNQRANTQSLAAKGAALAIDATGDLAGVAEGLTRLLADAALRGALSKASSALCDGGGAQRAAARLIGLLRE